MDLEKLIEEIKKHDILYNTEHKDFKNINERNHVWQIIATEMNVEQKVCEQEWNNLQLTFEELRTDEFTEWVYFDLLRFLEPYYKPAEKKTKTADLKKKYRPMSNDMTRILIKQIKKYGCIYDPELPEYSDREKRMFIWQLIAEELNLDVSVCKAKWKRLREGYKRRTMNMTEKGEQQRSTWRFYEDLNFLSNIDLDKRHNYVIKNPQPDVPKSQQEDFERIPISVPPADEEFLSTDDIPSSEVIELDAISFQNHNYDIPESSAAPESSAVVIKNPSCIRYENGKTILYLGSTEDSDDTTDSLSSLESNRKRKKKPLDMHKKFSKFIDETNIICNDLKGFQSENPGPISLLFSSLASSVQQANLSHKQKLLLQRQTCAYVFQKIAIYNAINKSV